MADLQVEGGSAPLHVLLAELIVERKAERQALIDKVAARGQRPNGLWDWRHGEARKFYRIEATIRSLEERHTLHVSSGRSWHLMCFGEFYAPGGGPNCGYRGIRNENVNLRGILEA